ncbi:hypothetical protein, partial [Rothia sp. HMSC061D12]|uniref:hypothetical protein n=1 Tax=Rothia sp. HMSC061D12 TaxID=1715161 RepID=UPI001AEF5905
KSLRKGREILSFSRHQSITVTASMKVPPKRKGNSSKQAADEEADGASMKVPPKKKGNLK